MKPVRTFLQTNAIKLWLNIEKPIHTLSKGKLAKNMFIKAVDHPYVGSKVKIIKETDNATYIAKFKDDGTFDDGEFKIMTGTDMHLYIYNIFLVILIPLPLSQVNIPA